MALPISEIKSGRYNYCFSTKISITWKTSVSSFYFEFLLQRVVCTREWCTSRIRFGMMNVNTLVSARTPALDCIDVMKGGSLSILFISFIWCIRLSKLIQKNKMIDTDWMFIYVYVSVSVYNFYVVKLHKLLTLMRWFSSG